MAQYRGTLNGQRGSASRLGSKSSGLVAYAASWQGAVRVSLWYDSRTDTDMADVSLTTHTNGAGTERVLYSGPVNGTPYKEASRAIQLLAHVPHNTMTATHKMIGQVAGCPGCDAEAILRDVEGENNV